ncbi:hypothetical protein Poly30_03370 [Planctomycetes bacterium Poly30]|uniref:Carboxypeptidase regulatory-like domain-containing protein n=1 Tax=Saltatorellus ferox TaxID=2528018 RepID=A0A518EL83_9BACT|nr:hypothetical protein Poly30_03370 [Planctomycetes bacterium Poly30]
MRLPALLTDPTLAVDPRWCLLVGELEPMDLVQPQQAYGELWTDDDERALAQPLRWSKDGERFAVFAQHPGSYRFRVVAHAAGVSPMMEVQLVLGESVDVGIVPLDTGYRMEGRATLRSGEPLAGCVLVFEATDPVVQGAGAEGSVLGDRRLEIRTDEEGAFRFSGLVPGDFEVRTKYGPLEVIEGNTVLAGTVGHRIVVEGSLLVVRLIAEKGPVVGIRRLVATPMTPGDARSLSKVLPNLHAIGSQRNSTRLVAVRSDTAYRLLGEDFMGRMYAADWPAGQPGGRHDLDLMPQAVEAGEILIRATGDGVSGEMQTVVTRLTRDGVHVRALEVARETGRGVHLHWLKGLPAGSYELACYLQNGGMLSLEKETYRVDVEAGVVTPVEAAVVTGGQLQIALRPPPGSEETRPALVHIRRRSATGDPNPWRPLLFWMEKGAAGRRRGELPRVRKERVPINSERAVTWAHPPGDYVLRITHPAFEERIVNCRLLAGQADTCEAQLER